jgi:hypothetical protein
MLLKKLFIGLLYLVFGVVHLAFMILFTLLNTSTTSSRKSTRRGGGVMCGPGGCSTSGRRRM